MRFLYAKLTGYIGFYNGLGLSSIEIDFSKAKNKICLISGPNGVGKSTLNNSLTLLPDGNDNFVPSMNASKFLRLTDGANIYEININHPIDKNNNRVVSKASITKNGLELNPNGNISSYKEIIFSEFNLDSNYTVLSKISSDDRGLADKKPAERKKIMASRIASLEVYNNIFKNLNKKANIFKSYINNLSTKIQNVGDESNLKATLLSINSRLSKLEEMIEKSKEEITKSKTIISMNDPDGSMQSRYDILKSNMVEVENESKKIYFVLCSMKDSIKEEIDIDDIDSVITTMNERLEKLTIEETANKIKESNLLSSISDINNKLDKIEVSIHNITSEINEELADTIKEYKTKMLLITSEFDDLGISDIEDTSRTEIEYTITFLNKFIIEIDQLYENCTGSVLEDVYKFKVSNVDITKMINNEINSLDLLNSSMEKIKAELTIVTNDVFASLELEKRPKNCKDDTCPFVKSALEIVSKYGSIDNIRKEQDTLSGNIVNTEKEIEEKQKYIEKLRYTLRISSEIDSITESIRSNYQLLSKFSITVDLLDENRFLELIKNENRFNSLRNLSKYFNVSNLITEYKSIKGILNNLETEYAVQQNNIKTKMNYEAERNSINQELNNAKEEYNKVFKEISFIQQMKQEISGKLSSYSGLKDIYSRWNEKESQKLAMQKEMEDIKKKFDSSFEIIAKINDLQELINNSSIEMKPLLEQRRNIESQLTMLDSFKTEYEMYKEKYIVIDKLRKYSSPTQGSIQSLFMSIYMDKTLSMVNQLLGMIFNGQYRILDYVINENEFRIPFVGNGMPVDDISSGSTSQVCIMGTIINLVLYNMGSSDFGIASLDEVDGGLDQANRYLFVDVIQKICDILHIDQLFTISHSIESALSAVDVILLSDSQEYKDLFANANIIYQVERR